MRYRAGRSASSPQRLQYPLPGLRRARVLHPGISERKEAADGTSDASPLSGRKTRCTRLSRTRSNVVRLARACASGTSGNSPCLNTTFICMA